MNDTEKLHAENQIRMIAMEKQLAELKMQLDENTVMTMRVNANTRDMVDIMESWKGAFKVFGWIGKAAKPVGATIVFFTSLWAMWPKK
jgi:hypothetical protein